ncbi:unnamed protein product [Cyclocybe aegerita]|uniref:Uncharacterized protein n=1 Tax=Cyclocybe aegerita TaxID=1973307 RepID=A0A8S0VTS3_CYCAE|nr:unnamed protein product [Cyclocybe aegerita]
MTHSSLASYMLSTNVHCLVSSLDSSSPLSLLAILVIYSSEIPSFAMLNLHRFLSPLINESTTCRQISNVSFPSSFRSPLYREGSLGVMEVTIASTEKDAR